MRLVKSLLLITIILFCGLSCSKRNDDHGADWVNNGHMAAASESIDECKGCHGSDLFGGSAGRDCYYCHFGPAGKYVLSNVAEIIGYSPNDNEKDPSNNSVVTSSLPNVPVNTYVYLKGKDVAESGTITWDLTVRPGGSGASLITVNSDTVKLLTDAEGFYKINVIVTHAAETITDDIVIYANSYIGVDVAGCDSCHQEEYDAWQTAGHSSINDDLLQEYYDGTRREYADECQQCHTTGYNDADYAVNGGYDDVAQEAGFTVADIFELDSFSLFESTYPSVAALSNNQCENCHGPASEHKGVSSLSERVCAQCHDVPVERDFTQVYQWRLSGHGDYTSTAFTTPTGENAKACSRCHTGGGFIDFLNGVEENDRRTDFQVITCAVCHDPHGNTNPNMLRSVYNVTLANGEYITTGGNGIYCMNCHQSRRDSQYYYVSETDNHFGPHYGPQADMYNGTNGYEYGENISSSPHKNVLASSGSCVKCHMATPDTMDFFNSSDNAFIAGEHTFNMTYNDLDNIAPCKNCHSDITTFNFPADGDYDGNGQTEGVQDEVAGLLNVLALKLPPLDSIDVDYVTNSYTDDEQKAAYNYLFVLKDRSYGIHNFGYAVDLLQTSYRNLTGNDIPGADIY